MSLFPMFVKLTGRLVVVVGGGAIAEGKLAQLRDAGACIRVVAPEVTATIASMARDAQLEWRAKSFEPADLDDAFLVIAATSAPGVNRAVFEQADAQKIFCNAVDDIDNCHFYYGAVVQRGDLQIAISTNGASPRLAQRIRRELEKLYGPEYATWLNWLGKARNLLRARNRQSSGPALERMASREVFERFTARARSSQKEAA